MDEVVERVQDELPTAVERCRLEITGIERWIGPALRRVFEVVADARIAPAGPPFARYHAVAGTAATFDVEAGLPLTEPLPAGAHGDVAPSRLPGGQVAVTEHRGPYAAMTPAYEALAAWVTRQGAEPDGAPWEVYLSEPGGDPAGWRTEVVQPFRYT